MLRHYYKFDIEKESLLSIEQSKFINQKESNFTCFVGIYENTDGVVDLTKTTVGCQCGTLVSRGQDYLDIDWNQAKKKLTWFLLEWLFSENLEWQYYDSFTL